MFYGSEIIWQEKDRKGLKYVPVISEELDICPHCGGEHILNIMISFYDIRRNALFLFSKPVIFDYFMTIPEDEMLFQIKMATFYNYKHWRLLR